MTAVTFFQNPDTTVSISIAFDTHEIVRPSTAADQAAYPVAWDTYRSMVNQSLTPTAPAPLDTITNDPQALVPNVLQLGDTIP